jgi:Lon protease-like protein
MSQEESLADFRGTVRLFPLPNLVLFPGVVQPLHIFEPRYRQLMADALEDDRLITLALLQPGWEESYHQAPPIHPVVCIGRVLHAERLADGRYNLLLRGLRRARVREEVSADRLYRLARVDLLDEVPVAAAVEAELRERLARWITENFADQPVAQEQLRQLLASELALGPLCDLFSFALPRELEVKQALLEELSVEARVRRLLEHLGEAGGGEEGQSRPFPPEFSAN